MSFAVALALALTPDVVELADGTRHVGEIAPAVVSSNTADARLELVTPQGVMVFTAGEVVRVERRAELVKDFRATLPAVHGQPHAFAGLARWCLDRGLYAEAFDCTDQLLALAPDHPAARALLDRLASEALLDGAAPSAVPDKAARRRLLERVAGKSASRSAFAHELLFRIPQEERVAALIGDLAAADPDVRSGAAEVLGDCQSDLALARVIRSSLIDPNANVRAHAGSAAIRSGHPEIVVPYLRALETDDSNLRERAYPVLAMLRDPRAVQSLIDVMKPRPVAAGGSGGLTHDHVYFGVQRSYVRDFDVEIAQGAVIAKPVIGIISSGSILDVAVAGVQVISYTERATVLALLHKLTGQKLGSDLLAWEDWWVKQRGKLPTAEQKS